MNKIDLVDLRKLQALLVDVDTARTALYGTGASFASDDAPALARTALCAIGARVVALASDLVETGHDDMRALLALDHAHSDDIELACQVMFWQLRNAIEAHI